MGNQTWDNAIDPFPSARGTAKNTFTALQDVAGVLSTPGSLPLTGANELKLGTKIVLEAYGEFSTTATPTLSFAFLYGAVPAAAGGVAIGQTTAIATGSGAAAWPWHMRWAGVITTVGTSGI